FSTAPIHPRYLHSFPTRRSSDLIRSRRSISPTDCWDETRRLNIARRFGSAMISNTDSILFVYSTEHMLVKVYSGRTRGNGCTDRSEEHTSELQSQSNLVCRLLLE